MTQQQQHTPLLELRNISVRHIKERRFFSANTWLQILQNIDLKMNAGDIVGIAGESGCGKSTLAQSIMGLTPLWQGGIFLNGKDCTGKIREIRNHIQLIFQDSTSALNPRQTVRMCLTEALLPNRRDHTHRGDAKVEVARVLDSVDLPQKLQHAYPHALSGGQRQRLCIARALCRRPKILICDEITSALDVSTQAQIVQMLLQAQKQFHLSILWISHDFALIEYLCKRLLVIDKGRVIEEGWCADLLSQPKHPRLKDFLETAAD